MERVINKEINIKELMNKIKNNLMYLGFAFFVSYAAASPQLVYPGGEIISNFYFVFVIIFIFSFLAIRFIILNKDLPIGQNKILKITSATSFVFTLFFIYLTYTENTSIHILIGTKNLGNINGFYILATFILIIMIHIILNLQKHIKLSKILPCLYPYFKMFGLSIILLFINIIVYTILSFSIYCC